MQAHPPHINLINFEIKIDMFKAYHLFFIISMLFWAARYFDFNFRRGYS